MAFEEIVLLYTKGGGGEGGEDGCLQMQAYTKIPIPDLKVGLGTRVGKMHFFLFIPMGWCHSVCGHVPKCG